MAKDIPIVQQAFLYDPATSGSHIPLDTPAWFAWLEHPTSRRFSYALHNRALGYIDGFMTVRKESRQRGNGYWSVYRRIEGRLRKAYLGPSHTLTSHRLEQIAASMRAPPCPSR